MSSRLIRVQFTALALGLSLVLSAAAPATLALAQSKDGSGGAGGARSPDPVTPDHKEVARIVYMNSDTTSSASDRTATIVSITNQSSDPCEVSVDWTYADGSSVVCTTVSTIVPGATHQHCTRAVPILVSTCQATCSPALTFHEGSGVVSRLKTCKNTLAIDARLYHMGAADVPVQGIADLKVIQFGKKNKFD